MINHTKVSGFRNHQVSGFRCQVLVRCQVSGVRCQGTEEWGQKTVVRVGGQIVGLGCQLLIIEKFGDSDILDLKNIWLGTGNA
jgi:hypothetical protein